ncbi:MAG: glycosyltransferase family 39 protein [Eubacteriales bacterium]|nr:glycosyltransferase family 39 protein [Eubacteriales bacterium]
MKQNKPVAFLSKYGVYALYLILTALCAYVCFARLDVDLIQHWDEARHGVNAYEMLKSHNYIVNTYNYQNDYFNLKPPLSYWGILLGFKLFGVGVFGMRFYSALSMLLTFLVLASYLLRRYGKTAALSSMLLFLTFRDLFYRHAARNADADAVYLLFFTIGCLCLLESVRHVHLLYLCGLMFALCFLSKSWHAFVLLPIGGLFLIVTGLIRRLRLRDWLLFLACALGPVALWAAVRYRYDGMAFLGQMFGVDVTQRISWSESSNPDYLFFLNYLLHSRAVLVMTATLAAGVLTLLLLRRRTAIGARTADSALTPAFWGLLLWILVPLVVFSLSHTYYYWYVYPVFPGLCAAASITVQKCRSACAPSLRGRLLFAAVFLLPALAALHYDKTTVQKINSLETSGFQQDIKIAMEQNPSLHGREIFVEKNDNEYKAAYDWEQAGLLMAELSGDLHCTDGGVDAFLQAPAGTLLIVDPATYEKYEKELSGCRIVYRREYLLLEKSPA